MRRWVLVAAAAAALVACDSTSPTAVGPPPSITAFSWRNNTAILACENLLTGEDAAAIRCVADGEARVRITVTDVLGDCRPSGLPHGSRCTTIEGRGTAEGFWEAPWARDATETAMTVTVTCEVFDSHGLVADERTTCIPSFGFAPPQHFFPPPWPDSCEAQRLSCHEAP